MHKFNLAQSWKKVNIIVFGGVLRAVESVTLITYHVKEFVSTKSNFSDNIAGVIDEVFCSYFKFVGRRFFVPFKMSFTNFGISRLMPHFSYKN